MFLYIILFVTVFLHPTATCCNASHCFRLPFSPCIAYFHTLCMLLCQQLMSHSVSTISTALFHSLCMFFPTFHCFLLSLCLMSAFHVSLGCIVSLYLIYSLHCLIFSFSYMSCRTSQYFEHPVVTCHFLYPLYDSTLYVFFPACVTFHML